jgi:hypothetical protein
MSIMTGQLDLLELLKGPSHVEPRKAYVDMTPAERVARWGYPHTVPGSSCLGCGYVFTGVQDGSNNHHMGPYGIACISMDLRKSHVLYYAMAASGRDVSADKCCWNGTHKGKPTRATWLWHVNDCILLARASWTLRPDHFEQWLATALAKNNIRTEEL